MLPPTDQMPHGNAILINQAARRLSPQAEGAQC